GTGYLREPAGGGSVPPRAPQNRRVAARKGDRGGGQLGHDRGGTRCSIPAVDPPLPIGDVMIAIEARQLTRVFGKVRAVDGADLAAEEGTVFGLLGPNGAGKSTLLKMFAGHLRASSGGASVFGQPI